MISPLIFRGPCHKKGLKEPSIPSSTSQWSHVRFHGSIGINRLQFANGDQVPAAVTETVL